MSQSHDAQETAQRVSGAIEAFDERTRGEIVVAGDTGYDETRAVWNGLVDEYPAVVLRCGGAADVARGVEFAREHDLSVSVRSGGHHESGASVAGEFVIDLGNLDSVQVNPETQRVRVEPGITAGELHAETARYGLAVPTGSANGIGLGGSTLGGGIGWLRREHGLGIDALRSVEVVTADGRLRHASPDSNPELFWALRGAGSEFGVVTAMEFDAYEVGPEVFSLGVFYPADATEQVMDAYRRFHADGDERLTSFLLCGYMPDLPPVPSEAAGTPIVGMMGCYAGSIEAGAEAAAPLRAITEPLADTSGPMPYVALHELGGMLYPDGDNYCWRSAFVDEWNQELTRVVNETAAAAPTPTCGVSVWPVDGAVQEPAADDTAFPWRDHDYMVVVEAHWTDADATEADADDGGTDAAHIQWTRETDRRIREAGGEGAYAGYPGLEETDEPFGELVYDGNYDELTGLKSEYDPDGVFGSRLNGD